MSTLRIRYLEKEFKLVESRVKLDFDSDENLEIEKKIVELRRCKTNIFYEMKSIKFTFLAIIKYVLIFSAIVWFFYPLNLYIGILMATLIAYVWAKSDNEELNGFAREMIDIADLKNEVKLLKKRQI